MLLFLFTICRINQMKDFYVWLGCYFVYMFVLFLIVLNRKTKYFGRLDVLILYPSTLLGASLTGILRTAFLCTGMDSVGKYFPGTSC